MAFASRQLDWLEEQALIISFSIKYFKTRLSLLRIQRQRGLETKELRDLKNRLEKPYQFGDEDSSDAGNDHRGMWNVSR